MSLCENCELSSTIPACNNVGGRGPEKPKLLVVLEFAPRNESIAPKRVKIIRDQLIEMGVDLKQVRWTGALRCHSAMRHAGETIEEQKTAIEINRIVKGCRDHLLAEIKECDPRSCCSWVT